MKIHLLLSQKIECANILSKNNKVYFPKADFLI